MDSLESELGIEHISFWLPDNVIRSADVVSDHGFDEDFVLSKLGIRERRELGRDMEVSDMAAFAVRNLLEETSTSPDEVGVLILVSQTADFSLPHTSAILQQKAGISEGAFVFDVSLGCSGFVLGLDIILGTMDRLGISKGILVTADAYSRVVDPKDRATAPLFGDGASATLVGKSRRWKMGRSDFGSQGSSHEKLIVPGSGTAAGPKKPLYMDGRGILDFTRKIIPESVDRALAKNHLSQGDIDFFVFHQANAFVLSILESAIGLPKEKVVRSLEDVGNTTSSSIPIALRREIIDSGANADSILISGFGVGLSWSSSVLMRV